MEKEHFREEHIQIEEILQREVKKNIDFSKTFQSLIYHYFDNSGRSFPWRKTSDPYSIFISEVMLQQTQAERVVSKYLSWTKCFPNFNALAKASFPKVLEEWQGLGYNRRAKFLHQSSKIAIEHYNGSIPNDREKLIEFPGIGPNTAASITAFAFNRPVVFIETNIRTVYLYFFFKDKENIDDKELFPIIEKTLDRENPKEWYNALMDYGAMLKKKHKNPSRKSKHHAKQKPFKGSDREIRGAILKALVSRDVIAEGDVSRMINKDPKRVQKNLLKLEKEGFIKSKNKHTMLFDKKY